MCLNPINLKRDKLVLSIILCCLCVTAACFCSSLADEIQEKMGHARCILWFPCSSTGKIQEEQKKTRWISWDHLGVTCYGSRKQWNMNFVTTLWCSIWTPSLCISRGRWRAGDGLGDSTKKENTPVSSGRMYWWIGVVGVVSSETPLTISEHSCLSWVLVNKHCTFLKLGDSCDSFLG